MYVKSPQKNLEVDLYKEHKQKQPDYHVENDNITLQVTGHFTYMHK